MLVLSLRTPRTRSTRPRAATLRRLVNAAFAVDVVHFGSHCRYLRVMTTGRFVIVVVLAVLVAAACLVLGEVRHWPALSVAGVVVLAWVVFTSSQRRRPR